MLFNTGIEIFRLLVFGVIEMLYWQLSFLKFSILFLLGINHSILAQTVSDIFPEEYRQKIDSAVLRNAVDRPALQATIEWIKQLAQSTQDPVILAELARLECANAEVETQTSKRLAFYKNCIDTADQALAENANEVVALYWKAVAMGKLSEKMSILDALRMTRSMENLFLRVIALDENYDNAGGHKALGRIYHQLPGFPISFGNNEKALFHLRRAYELFPEDIITRAFYAEILMDLDEKQEALRHAEFILAAPIEAENRFRYREFVEIARNIIRKNL